MIELLILLALAYCLRGWFATPTHEDVEDYVFYDVFLDEDE